MRGSQRVKRFGGAVLSLALLLAGCGSGGDGSGGPVVIGPTPTPTPTPTPGTGTCALRTRQDWALAQMREWYLFPETLPAFVNPAAYGNLSDYVDALTATARAQGKDRYFTYVTSIAAENAYYASGATAGFGIRLQVDDGARRIFVTESFEGSGAASAGVDRGTEILAIGTSTGTLQPVSGLVAGGTLYDAFGPDTNGTSRVFRLRDSAANGGGERVVTLTKTTFDIQPVSPRFGTRIIEEEGRKVGYVNLRTFITSAGPQLRTAFAQFKAQGVQDLVIDLRYNGGGLLSVAEVLGNLMGGARRSTDIFGRIAFRPEKAAAEDDTSYFTTQSETITPRRIAFIGFEGTASASELVINAFLPYLHADIALIGSNTYGKPVGQIAIDQSSCDDRLRVIAFAVKNAAGQGDYYHGLASVMEASCRADDDLAHTLGDPQEASVRQALDYIAGRACVPIGGSVVAARSAASSAAAEVAPTRKLAVPDRPSVPQRDVPGLF